jgi:hypothetical protein
VSITEDIGARTFPFNRANPPPHPNTAEPSLTLYQAVDAMRASGFTIPSFEELNRDHTIGMLAAKGASTRGYGFAGELLDHFLSGTGKQVVGPLRRAGVEVFTGLEALDQFRQVEGFGVGFDYSPQARVNKALLSAVRQYFATHPQATRISASTAWKPCETVDRDAKLALGHFYLKLHGVFVAQRDASGKVTSIDGGIQNVAFDLYDFSMVGYDLNALPLGIVKRQNLWLMQYAGLAKGFKVWLVGPVIRIKVQP